MSVGRVSAFPDKVDGHGDFTWKDVSAAEGSDLSVEDYVIGGGPIGTVGFVLIRNSLMIGL